MASTWTGVGTHNGANDPSPIDDASYFVGSDGNATGAGSLTVDDGTVLVLDSSNPSAEASLGIGVGSGADGTVTVTGDGSRISVPGTGLASPSGAAVRVGLNGGKGDLVIADGGALEIVDNDTTPIEAPDYNGTEALIIGRNGGEGNVLVTGDGSLLRVAGGAPVVQIGRANPDDGAGNSRANLIVTDGASFEITAVPGGSTASTGLDIGREDGSRGHMQVSGTDTSVVMTAQSLAYIRVGTFSAAPASGGGHGTLDIRGGASVTVNGGGQSYLGIGRGAGGEGEVVVTGPGSLLDISADDGQSGIDVGEQGGAGTLDILDQATVRITNTAGSAYIAVGAEYDSANAARTGTLTVDNATLLIDGGDDGAIMGIGVGAGSVGDAEFRNGASVSIASNQRSAIEVGQSGGTGTLNVLGGSEVVVTVESGTATPGERLTSFNVGMNAGGDGTVTISGAGSKIEFVAQDGQENVSLGMNIGRNGGTGIVRVEDGGSLIFDDPDTGAVDNTTESGSPTYYGETESFSIGRGTGSQGTLEVDGGTFSLTGTAVGGSIGRDGATGNVSVTNGSTFLLQTVTIGATGNVDLTVGRGTGGVGTFTIDNSDADMVSGPNGNANLQVGIQGGNGTLEVLNGATLDITGANAANLRIGADGGAGGLLVDDATLQIDGGDNGANLTIGYGAGGEAEFRNGAAVSITSNQRSGIEVGHTEGTGTLNVVGGAEITVGVESGSATPGERGTYFNVGMQTGSSGTVTISGAGSKIEFVAEDGQENVSLGMSIGRNGGTGMVRVEDGGSLIFDDPDTGEVDEITDSGSPTYYAETESFSIGRGSGSQGTLEVDDGTFSLTGTAVSGSIGRDGGTGTATVTNGSTFLLQTVTDGPTGTADLTIGRGTGGVGSFTIDDSQADLMSGSQGRASLNIGIQNGNGNLTLLNGGALDMVTGKVAVVRMGSEGGTGETMLNDASLSVIGMETNLLVGSNFDPSQANGTGKLTLLNGSQAQVQGSNITQFLVGNDGRGTVLIEESALIVKTTGDSGDGYIHAAIGAAGGRGDVVVTGTDANLIFEALGGAGAFLAIGTTGDNKKANSGKGTLTIKDGGTVTANVDGRFDLRLGGGTDSTYALNLDAGGTFDFGTNGSTVNFGSGVANTFIINGGTLKGDDIYINGGLRLNANSVIDMRNGASFKEITVAGATNVAGAGTAIRMSVGDTGSDQLVFKGAVKLKHDFDIELDAEGGFTFEKGDTRTLARFDGPTPTGEGVGDVTVSGQHADFAFFAGSLRANRKEWLIEALNSGDVGGDAVLDFGLTGPAANLSFDANSGSGTISGGRYDIGLVKNVTEVLGTNGNDKLEITVDGLWGLKIDGRGGNDKIRGSNGDDWLIGGEGNDRLAGGGGADTLDGGNGNDTYVLGSKADGVDTIIDSGGNDTIISSIGRDLSLAFYAEIENITLNGSGNIDAIGNAKANKMVGNSGNNRLDGGDGKDTLTGGAGKDTLTGGGGNDTFVFTKLTDSGIGNKADIITDFDDFGNDRIDLSAIYGPKLKYIHDAAFTGIGQVRVQKSGSDVIVQVNTKGSLAADFEIKLTGTNIKAMGADDFIL